MATVHITDTISRNVRYKLQDIYDKRICRVKAAVLTPVNNQAIYDFFMGDYLDMIEQSGLPKAMFRKVDVIDIFCRGIRFRTGLQNKQIFWDDAAAIMPFVERSSWDWDGDASINLKDRYDYSGTSLQLLVDTAEQVKQIEEEKDNAVRALNILLEKYSTLSPALKEFPALWDLLEDDVKAKHKEVVERKKPEPKPEVTETPDFSSLTAAVIANKLGA